MFHTLRYAKMLEEAGFSKEQAETSIRILVEIMEDKLASKQDLRDLKKDLQESICRVEAKLEHTSAQVDSKLTIIESKLTVKMGTMLAASIAVLTAIQKLI